MRPTQEREAMSLKEHLQFLFMMVPTLLLVLAALVSAALPAHEPRQGAADLQAELAVTADIEAGLQHASAVR